MKLLLEILHHTSPALTGRGGNTDRSPTSQAVSVGWTVIDLFTPGAENGSTNAKSPQSSLNLNRGWWKLPIFRSPSDATASLTSLNSGSYTRIPSMELYVKLLHAAEADLPDNAAGRWDQHGRWLICAR